VRSLQELTLWQRLGILLIILLTIALALLILDPDTQGAQGYAVPDRFHDDVLALDRRALDDAYVLQSQHLFRTWITDRLHDPSGIDTGLSKARQGYVIARERMEQRESK
jgi:hypothetical protein